MNPAAPNRTRVFAALASVIGVALLGLVCRIPGWRSADLFLQSSYDTLSSLATAPELTASNSPVAIVYLDLNSYNLLEQDMTAPWSRALHAALLNKLTKAQAKVVVFDIVFSSPGVDPAADEALATAIRANGKTILAGEASGKISHATDPAKEWTRASTIDPPWEKLRTLLMMIMPCGAMSPVALAQIKSPRSPGAWRNF